MLVLEDLYRLWEFTQQRKSNKIFGGVVEYNGTPPPSYHIFGSKKHYYPLTSLNTGILYYNFKRMRKKNITSETFLETNDEPSNLLDQDIINTWAYYNQEEIFEIPCQWNKRLRSNCEDYLYKNDTGILHGNGGIFVGTGSHFYFLLNYF